MTGVVGGGTAALSAATDANESGYNRTTTNKFQPITSTTERKDVQVTSVVKLASEKAAGHNEESVDAPYPSGEDCQNMSRDHG